MTEYSVDLMRHISAFIFCLKYYLKEHHVERLSINHAHHHPQLQICLFIVQYPREFCSNALLYGLVNGQHIRDSENDKERGDEYLKLLLSLSWVMSDNEIQSDKVTPRKRGNNKLEDVYKVISYYNSSSVCLCVCS